MNKADVLIIGAGAAGLMAARILTKAGKKVIVLEARKRCGGRIHTLYNHAFFKHVELGAEFVHGDLLVTLNLLNEAVISYYPAVAEMWQYKNGRFTKEDEVIEGWDMLMKKLGDLKSDMSIANFLEQEFPGEKYTALKKSVKRFVSGYDTADPEKASTFALRKEWQSEDEGAQHRIKGGYGAMIKFLENECRKHGGAVYLNSAVKEIKWSSNAVEVVTDTGARYHAGQVLVAVPLGVLQAEDSIIFNPPIPEQIKAISAMGFGAIIKILLEFEELFWEDKHAEALAGKGLKGMGFLLSDERIPTWWTQAPQYSQVLTGWLGGPAANEMKDLPEEEILEIALQSLSNIFEKSVDELKDMLIAFNIVNWTAEPFTLGSYAYDTVGAEDARKILSSPVENTIFFAGEYLYEGTAMGTVEAALTSGRDAAKALLSYSQ